MKDKITRYGRYLVSIVLGVYIPIFGIMGLYMLAGSNPKSGAIILLGLSLCLIGNIISYKKYWGWIILCFGLVIFYFGQYQDSQF